MAINRANIAKELLPGLNAVFGLEYNEEHTVLFDVEKSDRAFEEEVLFTGFGTAPVKTEGAAVQFDDAREGYTARYTNETVALAFAVTEEAMEDNLYDTFAKLRARGLARSMANTKQVKGADIFMVTSRVEMVYHFSVLLIQLPMRVIRLILSEQPIFQKPRWKLV